jgi:hydrogenase maturation protease
MHAPDLPPVTVFACGEPLRGDDGIAHAAVDGLPERMRHGAAIQHVTALGPEDLAALEPDATAIVVDAVVGIPVGEVVRYDLDRLPVHPAMRPTSSHQLPLDMVIGLAKLMGWEPHGAFIGVGAARFDHGNVLSPELSRIVPLVGEAIEAEIERAHLNAKPVAAWSETEDAPTEVRR